MAFYLRDLNDYLKTDAFLILTLYTHRKFLCQVLSAMSVTKMQTLLTTFLLGLIQGGSDSLHILLLLVLSLFLNTKKKCAYGWHRVLRSFSCSAVQPLQSNITHFVTSVHPGLPLSFPPGKPHFTGVHQHTTTTKPSPAALRTTEQRSPHRAGGRNPEDSFYPKSDGRDTAVS